MAAPIPEAPPVIKTAWSRELGIVGKLIVHSHLSISSGEVARTQDVLVQSGVPINNIARSDVNRNFEPAFTLIIRNQITRQCQADSIAVVYLI
jgi:hypothetical protein